MLRPEAHKTLNTLNLNLLDEIWLDDVAKMPTVDRCDIVPIRMIPFTKATRRKDLRGAIHFYIEDYSFSHFWSSPSAYMQRLEKFECVVAPDFSTYLDMPPALINWQIYRRRLLTQWMQRSGLNVIYNIQTLPEAYDDVQLSGVEPGGVLAMRLPLNYKRNKEGRQLLIRILDVINKRLTPQCILMYGEETKLPSNNKIIFYENDNIRIRRAVAARKRSILD